MDDKYLSVKNLMEQRELSKIFMDYNFCLFETVPENLILAIEYIFDPVLYI